MRMGSAFSRHGGFRASRRPVLMALAAMLAMVVAVSLSWAARPSQGAAMSPKDREIFMEVREIGSMLRAPCCPNLTVSKHSSPVTLKIRKKIEAMLREGKSRSAVISTLRAEYGDVIAPPMISALWRPWLYVGGPIAGLVLLAFLGRWLVRHERAPTVLHMDGPGKGAGSRSHAA